MAYYDFEQKLANNAGEQTSILKDVALSLQILSGRKTLKELRLEGKLEDIQRRLCNFSDTYPEVSPKQEKLLKEMDEVTEELWKERGEEWKWKK